MPERPDLEYVVPRLDRELSGLRVEGVHTQDPVVLRMGVQASAEALLVGSTLESVRRHLHFVVFSWRASEVSVVVAPMLAGCFRVVPATARRRKAECMSWLFEDGRELRYRDDVRMGKVYFMPSDQLHAIPRFSPVGVDVLDPRAFTVTVLRGLLRKRRDQVKLFLLDKNVIDSLGNAYADEVLFAAGLHPKTRCNKVDEEQAGRLHRSLVQVLTSAIHEIERRQPALDVKVRDFLKVRNRKGKPCPTCGARIRTAGVRGHDAFFCPTCQPDTTGRAFVDWRKLDRR